MRRRVLILALAAVMAIASWADAELVKKFEFSLTGGLALIRIKDPSVYHDQWQQELLANVLEETVITPMSRNAFITEAFLSFFLRPNVGLQIGLGCLSADVPNTAVFRFEYTWTSGLTAKKSQEWTGTGRLRMFPISLNAAGKIRKEKIEGFLSGGLTLFLNSLQSASAAGYGVSDIKSIWTYIPPVWSVTIIQTIDAIRPELTIEEYSWTALGFNIGGGLDYKLSEKIALTAEGRYFFCPAKEIPWSWKDGFYPGIYNVIPEWEFRYDKAEEAEEKTTPLSVRPAFFRLAAGLKIFF